MGAVGFDGVFRSDDLEDGDVPSAEIRAFGSDAVLSDGGGQLDSASSDLVAAGDYPQGGLVVFPVVGGYAIETIEHGQSDIDSAGMTDEPQGEFGVGQ